MLSLLPPAAGDLHELLQFEVSNRPFFEQSINARPAGFYCEAGVAQAIAQAERDAAQDAAYQYLLRDAGGSIVGRVNLTRVRRAHYHSAELGYRIAQAAGGKGYASEAVRRILDKAFGELGLRRIEATCRPENLGSLKVLTRNGFAPFGRSTKSFELAGQWHDLLHFDRRSDG